jgi:hypothetical protein
MSAGRTTTALLHQLTHHPVKCSRNITGIRRRTAIEQLHFISGNKAVPGVSVGLLMAKPNTG